MSEQYTLGDFRELTKLLPDDTPLVLLEEVGDADETLCVEFLGIDADVYSVEIKVMIESMEEEEEE